MGSLERGIQVIPPDDGLVAPGRNAPLRSVAVSRKFDSMEVVLMDYVLFQVVNTREYGWMGLEERGKVLCTECIDLDLYSVAYEGEVEDVIEGMSLVLAQLFEQFNSNHPAGYRGRSMSVSDLVVLDDRVFYCDSIGFVDVTDRIFSASEVELNCSSISPGGEVTTDAT